jgi:hypothetical protein
MTIKQCIAYYKKLGISGGAEHSGAPSGQREVDLRFFPTTAPERRVYITFRKNDGKVVAVLYWKLGENETFSLEEKQVLISLNTGNGPLVTKDVGDGSEFLVTTPGEYQLQDGEY